MAELPHVKSFDPEDKGGVVSQPVSENGTEPNAVHEEEEARLTKPVELDIADPHFMENAYDTYADLRTEGLGRVVPRARDGSYLLSIFNNTDVYG